MYVDRRPSGSTPEAWSSAIGGRWRIQERLSMRRLARDDRWAEFEPRVAAGARVLDAGSGTGTWVAFLAAHGYEPVGLDFAHDLVELARARYVDLAFTEGMVQEAPFDDAEFDAIVSWGVIEHDVDGPGRALAEFRRVLRPGGVLLVTVPIDSEAMRAASVAEHGDGDTFFQYFFSPAELNDAVAAAGFEVEKVGVSSRHFAPAFPRFHAWIAPRSAVSRDVAGYLLKPYVQRRDRAACMLLAVARSPTGA